MLRREAPRRSRRRRGARRAARATPAASSPGATASALTTRPRGGASPRPTRSPAAPGRARRRRSTAIRSQVETSSSSWLETRTMPLPFRASSRSSSRTCALLATSMPRVGSSTSSTSKSSRSMRAICTFCWLPPERSPTRWSGPLARTVSSSIQRAPSACGRARAHEERAARRERDVVRDRASEHEPLAAAVLAEEPDAPRRRRHDLAAPGRVEAEDRAKQLGAPRADEPGDTEDLAAPAARTWPRAASSRRASARTSRSSSASMPGVLRASPARALRGIRLAAHDSSSRPSISWTIALRRDVARVTRALHLAVAQHRVASPRAARTSARKCVTSTIARPDSFERLHALEEPVGVRLAEARRRLVEDEDARARRRPARARARSRRAAGRRRRARPHARRAGCASPATSASARSADRATPRSPGARRRRPRARCRARCSRPRRGADTASAPAAPSRRPRAARQPGRAARTACPRASSSRGPRRSTPSRMRISVLLPAPFSPSTACTSPARTSRSTPRRTTTGPNDFSIPASASLTPRATS